MEDTTKTLRWYAIHTHSKQESRAEDNLNMWKVETFAPKIIEPGSRSVNGERLYLTKPLFPRYIFARFDANSMLHKIRYTRGVSSVVGFGEDAVPVDDEVIAMIRSRMGADGFIRLEEGLKQGDRVVIDSGPFSGLEGVFERGVKDSDRVRVLLTVVRYQSHILVERESVKKLD